MMDGNPMKHRLNSHNETLVQISEFSNLLGFRMAYICFLATDHNRALGKKACKPME
jgi:hypothetical protein